MLHGTTGGPLATVLAALAVDLEEARRVDADARAATAQARYTAGMVALLPLGAVVLAELGSPGTLAVDPRLPAAGRARARRDPVPGRRPRSGLAAREGGSAVTSAVLLGALAGVCAAAGIVEMASVPRRPARRARRGVLLGALAAAGRALGAPSAPRDLEARIAAAGLYHRVGAAQAMAVKTGAALIALLLALPAAGALPGRLGLAALAGAPCAAFLAPDVWLRRRTLARARAMALELPDVLDLLRVAVGAGMAPRRALAEVARRRPGPLASELGAAAARIALGVPGRQALADVVARSPIPAVEALASALARAERHGTPLAPALAALAAQARADRAREVREQAARAAPKIQLAIALGLVPGVLLLVAAALVAALT